MSGALRSAKRTAPQVQAPVAKGGGSGCASLMGTHAPLRSRLAPERAVSEALPGRYFEALPLRQLFMNALRSSPIIPFALASALQVFIFSC